MSLSVLSQQQREYAEARYAGLPKKEAAMKAGCPEKTASQAASRLEKHPNVIAHLTRLNGDVTAATPIHEAPIGIPQTPPISIGSDDALAYFRAVMSNPKEDPKLRLDAAKALAAYTLTKPGELGKKDSRKGAANEAGKRYASAPPPPLRAVK